MQRKSNNRFKSLMLGVVALLVVGVLAACGDSNKEDNASNDNGSEDVTLTIYNGQHKDPTIALIEAFTEKTGIKVEDRDGSSNELAHQIVEEGDRSPADIIYTEESSPLIMLSNEGLLSTIDDTALEPIPEEYRDADGQWVGLLARSRVIVYDPALIDVADLPISILDLDNSKWKDQFGFVPTSGAFHAQISAMIKLEGEDVAKAWLEGLKENGQTYKKNSNALDAVERGEIPFALINNYYWDRQAKEVGEDEMNSKLHFLGTNDLGDLVTVSGAAILKSSPNQEAAQKFIEFATSEEGQQILTDLSAQYPLNQNVDTDGLKPFTELTPPNDTLDLGEYSDGKAAIELLQEVGLL